MSCQNCHKKSTELLKCGRCLSFEYCSRECQVTHWSVHKTNCLESNDRILDRILKNTSFNMLLQGLSHYSAMSQTDSLYTFLHCKVISQGNNNLCEITACTEPSDSLRSKMLPGKRNILFQINGDTKHRVPIGHKLNICKESYKILEQRFIFSTFSSPLQVLLKDNNYCAINIKDTFQEVF